MSCPDADPAGPPFKYPGGKRQLLWRLSELMPAKTNVYWEPFCGAATLFWHLAAQRRFKRAVLSDANEELIRVLLAIQRNVVGCLRELDKHVHTEAHYYRVRARDPKKMTDEACAARWLFMNAAGYNGMVRYAKAGNFNIPWGRYPKMQMFAGPAKLKACARVLNEAKVTIVAGDFEAITRKAKPGDAIYSDSPYQPVSASSNFTQYTPAGFDENDQRRLAVWFRKLDARGIPALLSNSRCEFTERLYSGLHVEGINAKRAINSDATKRGNVKEILVMTSTLAQMQATK